MTDLLDPRTLSPAAQRALGPGPGRVMAARGLLPLPPADQLAVLYQLAHDADAALAGSARTTAAGLPEKLLAGTLADASLDARVLGFFAELAGDKSTVFDAIVLNPSTADPTIAVLATKANPREIDFIAQNEQRLLRHPEIIAAMYMNRKARMSTIDRVVELAVRNNVRVPGLAAWDEVARALIGEPEATGPVDDALFESVLGARDDSALTKGDADAILPEDDEARVEAASSGKLIELTVQRPNEPTTRIPLRRSRFVVGSADCDFRLPNSPPQWIVVAIADDGIDVGVVATGERVHIAVNQTVTVDGARLSVGPIPFRDLPIAAKIRAATLGDAFVRSEAIRDPIKMVSMAAIKSPGVTDIEAQRYAANQSLSDDVVRHIALNRSWTKMYGVKFSLCRNPKAPISEVQRLLPFLREKDLATIVKSKGVPSAVAAQARKLQMSRQGGNKR